MRQGIRPLASSMILVVTVAVGAAAASDTTALVTAAKQRDTAEVKRLLAAAGAVDVPDADGSTALHWMARWNEAETVDALLRRGATVDAVNRYGATPLWVAASLGNVATVERLLAAGANPKRSALSGEPPIVTAALSGSAATVRALLVKGADVNATESWRGQTALMVAAGKHIPSPDVTKALLDHKADVNLHSKSGMSALHFAVRQNDIESVRLLLDAGASIDHAATKSETTALRVAIDNFHFDIAHLLIDRGANVNAADRSGFTPLFATVRTRAGANPERGETVPRGDEEATLSLLKKLIAKGADVNARLPAVRQPPNFNPDGYPQTNNVQYGGATPFWVAAVMADLQVMRLLVASGADPRATSMEGTTALMVAAGLGYGTRGPTSRLGGRRYDTDAAVVAAVEQLIKWGNPVNAINAKGQTALHGAVASASAPAVQVLLGHGVVLDQKDDIGRTALVMSDEHRTDKYRTNQSLDPKGIIATYELLQKVAGDHQR